jgi:hypothetical protein
VKSNLTAVVIGLAGAGVAYVGLSSVGREVFLATLALGPAVAGFLLGLASQTQMRYVATWVIPLGILQAIALFGLPFPIGLAIWTFGLAVVGLMLFSEPVGRWWEQQVDRV